MNYACDICGHIGEHSSRCPYFSPKKALQYCSACGEGIYDGEEYIENDGEYRHYDCFYGLRDLLGWLGYEIRTMEEGY